jgi:drug/metabolite transporter (DMT)-like permease
VSLFWGGNTVAIKLGLLDAPPLRLAWMRFLVGGLVIALWGWLTGRLASFTLSRDEWRPLLVLGAIFTAQIGLMNVGTALTSAAHGTVVLNLYAVHTVVLAHFLVPGDRLTVRRLAGVLVAYGGIVLLLGGDRAGTGASLVGDALVFASAFLLAERQIYLARAVRRFDPVKLLLAQAAAATVSFMALSTLLEPEPTHGRGGSAPPWPIRACSSQASASSSTCGSSSATAPARSPRCSSRSRSSASSWPRSSPATRSASSSWLPAWPSRWGWD